MNKTYFLSFILCIINIGCVSTHKNIKLKFDEDKRIKIKIPNNFVFEGLQGDYEKEYRYWYPDSSVIYITTFENTINYEVIRQQETYYNRFEAFHSGFNILPKPLEEIIEEADLDKGTKNLTKTEDMLKVRLNMVNEATKTATIEQIKSSENK